MTIALAIACGVLAGVAVALVVLLVRTRPAAPDELQPPLDGAEPAVEELARDLREALAQYRSEPAVPIRGTSAAQHEHQPETPVVRPAHSRRVPRHSPEARASRGSRAHPELEQLLEQALATARAIPGADAAVVALPVWRQPVVGTVGLSRREANRLAETLPSTGARTRSVVIEYEYENGEDGSGGRSRDRLERGIAVPIGGLPTPGLLGILTRSPEVRLGTPQVELLEEIVERLGPALGQVLDWDAASLPARITVREPAGRGNETAGKGGSAEGQEREELGQVDRLHHG